MGTHSSASVLALCSQTMVQQFELMFECAVRQSIIQEVPLVNTSDQYMQVRQYRL